MDSTRACIHSFLVAATSIWSLIIGEDTSSLFTKRVTEQLPVSSPDTLDNIQPCCQLPLGHCGPYLRRRRLSFSIFAPITLPLHAPTDPPQEGNLSLLLYHLLVCETSLTGDSTPTRGLYIPRHQPPMLDHCLVDAEQQ